MVRPNWVTGIIRSQCIGLSGLTLNSQFHTSINEIADAFECLSICSCKNVCYVKLEMLFPRSNRSKTSKRYSSLKALLIFFKLLLNSSLRKHRGVKEKKIYIVKFCVTSCYFAKHILLFRENILLLREKHLVISRKISHYFAKNILSFHEKYVISRKYLVIPK